MRDLDSIAPTVSRIEADFGKIDVLVNNAGYGLVGAAEETTESEYRPLFDVNFFGMTEITKAVLPGMRSRRHGHIISTASQVGFVAMVGYAYYSASKFAMEGFCEALAVETAPLGIKVTILEPGAVRTDFAGGSMKSAKRSIEDYASTAGRVRQLVKDNNGLQPNDPQKIAEAICTIANDEAPPLRLVLGLDALAAIEKKLDRTRKTIDQWRDLASSVGFDA